MWNHLYRQSNLGPSWRCSSDYGPDVKELMPFLPLFRELARDVAKTQPVPVRVGTRRIGGRIGKDWDQLERNTFDHFDSPDRVA